MVAVNTAPFVPTQTQTNAQQASIGSNLVGDIFSGLAKDLAGIFGALPWVRIGETVLGLLLIAVGLTKLTSGAPTPAKLISKALS